MLPLSIHPSIPSVLPLIIPSSLISQIWQELNEAVGESAALLLEVRITLREIERMRGIGREVEEDEEG